jgi:hypothetical protein
MTDTPEPHRVQLKRTKGWKMPENTVKIDRTTRWGNPFAPADSGSVAQAVKNHAAWMAGELAAPDGRTPPPADEIRAALRGRNLACWCALDGPCHADLMLKIANGR